MPDLSKQIWRQAIIDLPTPLADSLASLLADIGALGCEVIDDETRAMAGARATLRNQTTLVVSFEPRPSLEADVGAVIARLVKHIDDVPEIELMWRDVEQEDWNAAFKASWQPLFLTENVVVVPSWATEWPHADVEIFIDPGSAFGTGTHETTQLCAKILAENLSAEKTLLDVGTGSGILAIMAMRLGVQKAVGTDIDPNAARQAYENAKHNDCAERFQTTVEMPHTLGERFDIVVANILVDPLLSLAESIAAATVPAGTVILSGILENQAAAVIEEYEKHGLSLSETRTKQDWVGLRFTL